MRSKTERDPLQLFIDTDVILHNASQGEKKTFKDLLYLLNLQRSRQVVDEIKSWTLRPLGFREILSIFNLELTKGFQQWVVSFVMVTLGHRSEHKVLSLTPANLVHIHICSHTQVWSIPGSHDNY